MSEAPEEWLTIAQAAKRLGMAERQARRWAAKLVDGDRTLDRTVTGRPRTLIRFSALAEMERERTSVADTDRTPGKTDRTSDRTVTGLGEPQATLPAVAYQRVMSEQAARIGELTTALEHEREQSRRMTEALQLAQENLQREQSLRLLSSPAADSAAAETTGEVKEGWWARLFRKKH